MDSNRIYGIDCKVSNCIYNKNDCECTAGKICVCADCSCAEDSGSTCCKTFKPRD